MARFAVTCWARETIETSFTLLPKQCSLFSRSAALSPLQRAFAQIHSLAYLVWLARSAGRASFDPHFHINLLPEARKVSTTRALLSAYLRYLYQCGERRVYGQIVTFESRRGEKLFERYGFKVFNRARSRNTNRSILNRSISAP